MGKKHSRHNKKLIKLREMKTLANPIKVKRTRDIIQDYAPAMAHIRGTKAFMCELGKEQTDRMHGKPCEPQQHKEKEYLHEYTKSKFGSVLKNRGQQKTVYDTCM